MAEAEFFLTERNESVLIERMLADGVELIPDLLYEHQQFLRIDSVTGFREARRQTRKFFALYPQLVESPLELQFVEHREQGARYFIKQRHGGPAIDIGCAARVERGDQLFCSASTLGLYPSYWSTRDKRQHKPPAELVKKYRVWVDFLKRDAVRIAFPGARRSYWVSPDFAAAYSRDLVRLGPPFEDRQETLAAALAH